VWNLYHCVLRGPLKINEAQRDYTLVLEIVICWPSTMKVQVSYSKQSKTKQEWGISEHIHVSRSRGRCWVRDRKSSRTLQKWELFVTKGSSIHPYLHVYFLGVVNCSAINGIILNNFIWCVFVSLTVFHNSAFSFYGRPKKVNQATLEEQSQWLWIIN
jgi:hypothetical protein